MKDQVLNMKTENTNNIPSQSIKTEEIEKVEVKNEVIVKQVDENVKSENITEQKDIKSENEDEKNIKIDVTSCSPGYEIIY